MATILKFEPLHKPVDTQLVIVNPKCRCAHPKLLLDESSRLAQCEKCGCLIDPFDALLQYAKDERRFMCKAIKYNAAIEEFNKIQSEWSLTTREKRRIQKAMDAAKYPQNGDEVE